MAEEDFDEKNEQTKSALDSMLSTAQEKQTDRQKQFEQEFIDSQGKLNEGEAYQAAMDELRSRGVGPTDKIKTYNPQSQRFDTQEIRQPFLNRTAPALTPSGIDPRMAREMLDYAETNQFSFAPNISSPLQELADNAYGTSTRTNRNREGITVDSRLEQAKELRKQAFDAMDQGARGGQNTEESDRLNAEAQALEDAARNDAFDNRRGGANPRSLEDLTANNEEATPTTDDTETEQSATATITDENQTDEQKYQTFAERRMQRNLDNLGLGNTNEAKALALRLDAAGISSLRFGTFIKQNNKNRLALGKAAHSDLDSYMGDFLLTQAEKEASGKTAGYGIRRNRLPQGRYDPETGERYIPTMTKGGKELRALQSLRSLVERGDLDYSQLDQLLFAKGTGATTFDARSADQAAGGGQNIIPLNLNQYSALLEEKEVETKAIAREATKAGNLLAKQQTELTLNRLSLSKEKNLQRRAQLETPDATGKVPRQGIELYKSLQAQLEKAISPEMQEKLTKQMESTLAEYGITISDIEFYTIVTALEK